MPQTRLFVLVGAVEADSCCGGWLCRVTTTMRLEGLVCQATVPVRAGGCAMCFAGIAGTYCSVPTGAPSTVRPCCSGGRARSPTQVSGPNVSVFAGRWPLLFRILVLPGLRRMLACAARWLASRSYTGRTLSGLHGDIPCVPKRGPFHS